MLYYTTLLDGKARGLGAVRCRREPVRRCSTPVGNRRSRPCWKHGTNAFSGSRLQGEE
jgi:hypothetical protein